MTWVVCVAGCSTSGDDLFGEATGAGAASAGAAGPAGPGPGGATTSGDPQSSSSAGAGGPASGPGPGGSGPGNGGAGPGGSGAGGKHEGGSGPSDVGCSDGTREYFADVGAQPDIAGCDGAFQIPGTTSDASTMPMCDRMSGNDGAILDGEGCTIEDLCAKGWHVCVDDDEVGAKSSTGECEPALSATFYLTRQSQDPNGDCADPPAVNNLVGCGTIGDESPANCNPLSRYMRYAHCIPSPTWFCGSNMMDGSHEADLVAKIGPAEGGVLCCRK
ncbi:MAG: hypothetical protein WKG00_22285 [Polyangiaceae bacterium]